MKAKLNKAAQEEEEEEEQGVREALALLRRAESPPSRPRASKKEADRTELAEAFLRSSHTGLAHRPTISMDVHVQGAHKSKRRVTRNEKDMDFLPTQVTTEDTCFVNY